MGFRGEYDISKIALRILRWCSAFLVIVVVQPPLAADSSGCTQTHDLPVPGNSIDAVLGGGEFHCYRVPANHGGRLAVVIPQRGIVDVRLETPTGHVIDSPMHYAGDEWWLLGEEPAGHLRISSAAPYGASGTYMLNVERVGPKEMTIATRYSRAIHELRDVSRHPGLASEFFSISAEWKNTDRTQWAALAAHVAGFLWWQAGETDRAIEAFGNARALYRRSGDDANEAMLLNHHAMLALDINDFDAAVDLLDQARQIQQTRHYRHGLATTLNNHGLVRHYRGELDAARTFYLEAAELNAMLGRPQERLVQLNNLGGIHFVRGEAHAAEERFREAVHVAKQFKDDDKWTSALGNLGLVHMNSGAYLEALATYTQLLAVCRETGDARCGARTLGRIGQAYLRLGDPQRAIEYLQQADERRRALDDRRGRAQTLRHLAEAERRMGNFPEARRAIEEALKLESGPGQAGRAMLVVGWLFLDERNFDAARAAFLEAASRFEAAGEQHWSAVAKIRVAMATVLGGGRVDTDALRALRPSLQQGGLVDGEVELHYALALAAHAQGRLAQAMQALDDAQKLMDATRDAIPLPELRAGFTSSRSDLYDLRVEVLMAMHDREPDAGHAEHALLASDAARAELMLDLLREHAAPAGGASATLAAQRARLLRKVNFRISQRAGTAAGDAELVEWRAQLDVIDAELAQANAVYGALASSQKPDLDALRRQLRPDAAILYYHLGKRESHAWVITREAVDVRRLVTASETARRVEQVLDVIERRSVPAPRREEALEALAAAALHPAGDALAKYGQWYIVADGALHAAPFAALSDAAGEGVVSKHTLHMISSLRLFDATPSRSPSERGDVVLVSDPVYDADDPRLRVAGSGDDGMTKAGRLTSSSRESDAVRSLLDSMKVHAYAGLAARPSVMRDPQLAEARIVHFAVHGVFDTRSPALSGLLLSRFDEQGKPGNGFVGLRDIYALDWRADLVVLSGCETGRGRQLDGVGVIGMTNGFLAAGVAQTVASLWRIPDTATASFMQHFYAGLEQGNAAEALRFAQLEMQRDRRWRHPYFWSGFVVHEAGYGGERNSIFATVAK